MGCASLLLRYPNDFSSSPTRGEEYPSSMIIPRNTLGLIDILVLHRILQHHAGAHLANMGALDFLPGSLGGGIFIPARRFQRRAALGQFFVADQDIGGAFAQVDAHPVVGLEQCQSAAGGSLGRSIQDRWRTRRARLAAIADTCLLYTSPSPRDS